MSDAALYRMIQRAARYNSRPVELDEITEHIRYFAPRVTISKVRLEAAVAVMVGRGELVEVDVEVYHPTRGRARAYRPGALPEASAAMVHALFHCTSRTCDGHAVATIPLPIWEARRGLARCPACGRMVPQSERTFLLLSEELFTRQSELAHAIEQVPKAEEARRAALCEELQRVNAALHGHDPDPFPSVEELRRQQELTDRIIDEILQEEAQR